MDKRTPDVAFACMLWSAIGSLVGLAVSQQFGWSWWPMIPCAALGASGAYLFHDLAEVRRGIVQSYQKTIAWRPDWELWQVAGLGVIEGFFLTMLLLAIYVGEDSSFGVLWRPEMSINQLRILGIGFMTLSVFMVTLNEWRYYIDAWDREQRAQHQKVCQERCQQPCKFYSGRGCCFCKEWAVTEMKGWAMLALIFNPFTAYLMFRTLCIIAIVLISVGLCWEAFLLVRGNAHRLLRKTANAVTAATVRVYAFTVETIRYIHSDERRVRLVATLAATLTGFLIGHQYHHVLIGTLAGSSAGALFGTLLWEIVAIRVFHAVPTKS